MDGQRNSTQAMHGLGLAYAYMGEEAKAVATMEKAMAQAADRAIVHNLAVMHLHDRNPVRAAKFIRDYLSRPGVPLDEPLQNLLGAALAAASDDARSGPVYAEVREFFFVYDGRLNAARTDGKKRWGMRWIPAGQADYNWKVSKARAEEFERLRIAAGRATVRKQRARDAVHDFNTSMALHSDDEQRDGLAADGGRGEGRTRRAQDPRRRPETPRTDGDAAVPEGLPVHPDRRDHARQAPAAALNDVA